MSPRSDRKSTRSKRRRILGFVAIPFLLMIALGILAIPFLDVPQEAEAAKGDLDTAASAFQTGDVGAARGAVERARAHVDNAQDAIQGLGGDVWSAIPLLGTPVADAQNLVQALDDATAVAEIGVDLYPKVAGRRATLVQDKQVDEVTLHDVIDGAERAGAHLLSADSALDDVKGTTPIVGDTIAARRDEAAARVNPMLDSYTQMQPLLDQLPAMLGFEGRRKYLIAMLNPAELRYSGGAALAYAPLSLNEGKFEIGDTHTVASDPSLRTRTSWRKVRGNDFHRGNAHVLNSTFAPSWSTSGEELLRAWRATHDERYRALIAVDVVAMSQLLGTVGGTVVPGYGELTEDNLVETLIGNYDQYYPDPNAQDALNAQLIPAFTESLFGEGSKVEKAKALSEAAKGRHFAMYFRDSEVQEAVTSLGMHGNLATPVGDYLGVFTQNVNGSKVDYWQRRRLTLDVKLAEDGSTTNRLAVLIDNDTPPYTLPVPDPRFGYFTRWAQISAGVFLPDGVTVDRASSRGEVWDPRVRKHYQHNFVTTPLTLEPQASGELHLSYDVPEAATVDDDGTLTYRLAMDPQGTVIPQSVDVTVRLPAGYRATSLPEGWTADRRTVSFATEGLETSEQWEISLEKSD